MPKKKRKSSLGRSTANSKNMKKQDLMRMIKHTLKDWMLRKKGISLKETQRLLSTKTLDWLKGELKKI